MTTTYNAIQFLNALSGLFDSAHLNKTKATRAIGLRVGVSWLCTNHKSMAHSLVIHNGHFFAATKAAKLIFKVAFLSPDA